MSGRESQTPSGDMGVMDHLAKALRELEEDKDYKNEEDLEKGEAPNQGVEYFHHKMHGAIREIVESGSLDNVSAARVLDGYIAASELEASEIQTLFARALASKGITDLRILGQIIGYLKGHDSHLSSEEVVTTYYKNWGKE